MIRGGWWFHVSTRAVPITLIMFPTFPNQLITDTPAIPMAAFLQQDLLGVVASPYPAFEAPYLL